MIPAFSHMDELFLFFTIGATGFSHYAVLSHKNVFFFHDECMSLVILLSVLRLVKVSLVAASMRCCYCFLFHHCPHQPSLPHYHDFQDRCHVYWRLPGVLYVSSFLSSPPAAPFYSSSFLTSFKCNKYRLQFESVVSGLVL